jgi:hypothetical protein
MVLVAIAYAGTVVRCKFPTLAVQLAAAIR